MFMDVELRQDLRFSCVQTDIFIGSFEMREGEEERVKHK
jgi:hypothetical protein